MLKLSKPNISEEAIAAVAQVLRSGNLVQGTENEAFERGLAQYLGCSDVVLVSSGTAALHLALMGLDIGPGDAVIVPDFTFPATANVVKLVGAQPVIVDVDPRTYNIDVDALDDIIGGWNGSVQLRAIMPVHEFGRPADMARINDIAHAYGLLVVEDAACALGAHIDGQKVGTFGAVGCFSFHPRKTITTGEGGALSTNDPALAERLRRLRNHGMERDANGLHFIESSTNYRLTQFQAALGHHQLPLLDDWIAKRRQLIEHYEKRFKQGTMAERLALPDIVEGHSWQTFMPVLADHYNRPQIMAKLRNNGVEAGPGAQSLTEIGLYGHMGSEIHTGPRLAQFGLALPLYEQMTIVEVDHICDVLLEILR